MMNFLHKILLQNGLSIYTKTQKISTSNLNRTKFITIDKTRLFNYYFYCGKLFMCRGKFFRRVARRLSCAFSCWDGKIGKASAPCHSSCETEFSSVSAGCEKYMSETQKRHSPPTGKTGEGGCVNASLSRILLGIFGKILFIFPHPFVFLERNMSSCELHDNNALNIRDSSRKNGKFRYFFPHEFCNPRNRDTFHQLCGMIRRKGSFYLKTDFFLIYFQMKFSTILNSYNRYLIKILRDNEKK